MKSDSRPRIYWVYRYLNRSVSLCRFGSGLLGSSFLATTGNPGVHGSQVMPGMTGALEMMPWPAIAGQEPLARRPVQRVGESVFQRQIPPTSRWPCRQSGGSAACRDFWPAVSADGACRSKRSSAPRKSRRLRVTTTSASPATASSIKWLSDSSFKLGRHKK